MINIKNLASLIGTDEYSGVVSEVKNIFYQSSSLKEFSSLERKEAFFKRWCGDYIEKLPEHFWVMTDVVDNAVLVRGYLSGCLNSSVGLGFLEVPGYDVFQDHFERFPAHFHINFHPDCRGLGLGSVLVENFIQRLVESRVKGVHLVTSPGAPNISFYLKLKFDQQIERDFKSMKLLFMGRTLEQLAQVSP